MVRSNTNLVDTAMPVMAPYGILSPATTLKDLPDEFQSGFTYIISDAGLVIKNVALYGGGSGSETVVDNSENKQNFGMYYPFNIEASIQASTMGTNADDLRVSANNALNLVAQKAIESEFWHGTVAKSLTKNNDNRYLSKTDALDVTPIKGTAVKILHGQAILEQALAQAPLGTVGTIHAPKSIGSNLKTSPDGGALKTNLGTNVVVGSGYSGIGPDGMVAPLSKAWMYATGPVTVHMGATNVVPEKLNQAIDTQKNIITYYVNRAAAVTWSTTHLYAVLVDLTLDYS